MPIIIGGTFAVPETSPAKKIAHTVPKITNIKFNVVPYACLYKKILRREKDI
jgi:hypothetical protein|tara:strand:+ start:12237 stop:12392 length:156 start_codon:yes stop_codon:yes gene_type:complete